jgi:hypothetical protein
MPGPRLGQNVFKNPASTGLDAATEDLLQVPIAGPVGSISKEKLAQVIAETVPPPPWEIDPSYDRHDSDARKFVEAPDNVTLRWLNPKIVSQSSMRDWQAVPAKGDRRFRLKLGSMAAPDNTIRRGDHNGDFLAWMYTAWVESRNRLKQARRDRQASSAAQRARDTQEAYRRGKFGRFITSPDDARDPTGTLADGRGLDKD